MHPALSEVPLDRARVAHAARERDKGSKEIVVAEMDKLANLARFLWFDM